MKVFRAYFSPETFDVPPDRQKQVVGEAHINEGNGYTKEEIQAILNLNVGQIWTSNDYQSEHTITRIR